jgi:tetrathionate reductase subunit B
MDAGTSTPKRIPRTSARSAITGLPRGCRRLGDLKNPNDPIHEFLRTHMVQVLKPQMATHPKTFYNGLDGAVR